MKTPIVGILLAAGQGTRFGSNKLLCPVSDDLPMVLQSARHLGKVMGNTLAVVDDMNGEVARLLTAEGMQVILNPLATDGMGTSIACGVANTQEAYGWVITLADMPCIPERIIQSVAAGLELGADIIAPVYKQQRGHPVGFSARHASALMLLGDDRGAQNIIRANSASVELITTTDRGVIYDIDTPEQILDI